MGTSTVSAFLFITIIHPHLFTVLAAFILVSILRDNRPSFMNSFGLSLFTALSWFDLHSFSQSIVFGCGHSPSFINSFRILNLLIHSWLWLPAFNPREGGGEGPQGGRIVCVSVCVYFR